MKKAFLFLSIFLTSTFINAQESGETGAVESEVYFDLDHNSFSEDIYEFSWDRIIPDINESENHPNGFDGLPINCYEEDAPSNCYDQEDKIVNDISKTANDKKTPIVYISVELKTSSSSSTSSYDISFPSVDQSSSSASPILITPPPAAISTVKFIFKEGSKIAKTAPYKALCLLQEKKYSVDGKKLEDIYPSEKARNEAITKDGFELSDNNPQICSNTKETFKIQKNTSTGLKEVSIDISGYKDGGLFTLVGKTKKPGTKAYIWTNILKIRIIPYTPIVKEFVFIELDGGDEDRKEWDPLTKDPDNSITAKGVLDYFNKVYKQAAVKASITIGRELDKNGNEIGDFAIDENKVITKDMEGKEFRKFKPNNIDLIEVNMTEKYLSKDEEKIKEAAIEFFAKYGNPKNNKSKYFHIIFAINKERKTWNINNCYDREHDRIDLTFCNGFKPENEPDYVNYYITEDKCVRKTSETESTKKNVKIKKDGNDHYYAFLEKEAMIYEKEPMKFKGCEALHTDNGYPILLNKNAGLGGVNHFWEKNELQQVANKKKDLEKSTLIKITDSDVEYENHLNYGSLMFVKRSSGEKGQYIVAHELGHTFGLTDVAVNIQEKANIKRDGTFETNLMNWTVPIGPKIRYRDTPISCTMGKKVKINLEYNSKGKLCKKGESCKSRSFETYKENKTTASDKHENQWECIRDCYRPQIITKNRLKYWKNNRSNLEDIFTEADLKKIGIKDLTGLGENECFDNETIEEVSFAKLVSTTKLIGSKKIKLTASETIKKLFDEYTPPPPLWMLQSFYSAKELKNFFASELNDSYSVKDLATYYPPKDLKNLFSLEDFACYFYGREEMLLEVYKKEDLEPFDYCLDEKKLGI